MKRVLLLVTVALMLAAAMALSGVAAWAAPGGNSANAAKCEEGGYLDYTDANGNPFKNEGQCTRYAARGGQLVPVPTGPDISLDQAAGSISVTGFTPNSTLTTFFLRFSPNGDQVSVPNVFATDATGAFSTVNTFNFCYDPTNTGVEVTITDSAGVSATESFPLSCGT